MNKKCILCNNIYLNTSDFFYKMPAKNGNKIYLSKKCKFCINAHIKEIQSIPFTNSWYKYKFYRYKNKAKARKISFSLNLEDFSHIFEPKKCFYCGKNKNVLFTIDRKNNNKEYIKSNCVLACWKCNSLKSDYTSQHIKPILLRIKILKKIVSVLKEGT